MITLVGIDTNTAGIGIPAYGISVQYRSIFVQDWVPLIRYRTAPGIGILIHSGFGLTGCLTVWHLKTLYEGDEGNIRTSILLAIKWYTLLSA